MQKKINESWYEETEDGKILLYTPLCDDRLEYCKHNGGRRAEVKFPKCYNPQVAFYLPRSCLPKLYEMIGRDLDDRVQIEVGRGEWVGRGQLYIGWHVLARRALHYKKVYLDAEKISGGFPDQGGIDGDPQVLPSRDTRFRLWVPRDFAEDRDLNIVNEKEVKVYEGEVPDYVRDPMPEFTALELMEIAAWKLRKANEESKKSRKPTYKSRSRFNGE